MRNPKVMGVFFAIFAILSLMGCSGGLNPMTPSPQAKTADVFMVGTDAPLPSVVSCDVTITGVTLFDGTNNIPVMTDTPQTIDFAKLSGLHQLMDLNAVPTGTYYSATVTLSTAVIGYLDTSVTPPAVNTTNGTLTQSSVTVQFAKPFVLNDNDLVGLRMEFDLHKSILTDQSGNFTGQINPTFDMRLLAADDAQVSIDDFRVGFVGTDGGNSFTVQGPLGRHWTVQADANTAWDDPTDPLGSFTNNTILEVSGKLDPVTKDIDASEIEVVSNDGFVLGGLFTYINPASPQPATEADLYVRSELPDVPGIQPGQIEALTLNGSENYRIANIRNPLTSLLFSNTLLAPGQRVDVGGKIDTSTDPPTLTPHRVVLRRQGQFGQWVAGSTITQSGNAGSFQLSDQSTAGVLLPNPLTILTTNDTIFINLSGLSALTGSNPIPIRVVGFVLVDAQTSQPVMVARSVEELTQ
ncbi:MAG TPA: DUF4382 domain-containing protein [Candidatus Acidoferrales bacterium]|nr:DUF4382 domain-containing protein [Candidatus Acidoferrales bacterium]